MPEVMPQLGQTVHFVLNQGPNAGAHRPAIVVGVVNSYTVDLQVFSNGTKGQMPKGDQLPNLFWKPKCVQDERGKSQGTWHYGEPIL